MTTPTITDRAFGIEIEFASGATHMELARKLCEAGVPARTERYNHTTRNHWKIVSDASLRGRNPGELVSPILRGQEGLEALRKVCRVLNELDVAVNRSCGLHVHLDGRDLTTEQVIKVYDRYATYQAQIDRVMPRSRRGESQWAGNCRLGALANLADLSHARRYEKVNVQNMGLGGRGSIEFRQHGGTTEFRKIANWLAFLMQFVERSISTGAAAPQFSKTRWYSHVRALVERAGGQMRHVRFTDRWEITHALITPLQVTIAQLDQFYEDQGVHGKRGTVNARGLGIWLRSMAERTPEGRTVTNRQGTRALSRAIALAGQDADTGWLSGVTPEVAEYMAQREEELAA
tara:strand:+ start:6188 stop:7228 length:1041 start_codon:yes stop_codon:yes gene_type:complete